MDRLVELHVGERILTREQVAALERWLRGDDDDAAS